MSRMLLTQIASYIELSEAEQAAVRNLFSPVRVLPPNTELIQEGQVWDHGYVMVEGWAMRYRSLSDGRRQITRFLIPGDLCDPIFFVARTAIDSLATITEAAVATYTTEDLLELFRTHPRVSVAFWWLVGHHKALLQEHLLAVGRQTAYERTAYLIWELWRRMKLAGNAPDVSFQFPMTQEVLADALGLSTVHVNRTLRLLRDDGLIRLRSRRISILDPEGLRAIAEAREPRLLLDGAPDSLRAAQALAS